MSITQARLEEFAKYVKNHDAFEEIQDRINRRFFAKFCDGTDEERKVVGDMMNNSKLFYRELNVILDEILETANDE